jgi:Protein of unknown function (DUF2934)
MTQASTRNVTQMSKNQGDPADREGMNMQEEIRQRAYELYEERGRHNGHQLEDWTQAEQEVRDKFGLRKAA